jgi:hypothetical protein
VASSTKSKLEEINNVSRQLLSRITEVERNLKNISQALEGDITEEPDDIIILMENRQELISHFFNQHSLQEISLEELLINELHQLDQKLTTASNACKKSIMEQVIKLKKSNKVTKSYQKY